LKILIIFWSYFDTFLRIFFHYQLGFRSLKTVYIFAISGRCFWFKWVDRTKKQV
jgi:hypothetical protein